MQKSSTKTRIETIRSLTISRFSFLSCKSRLRKQGLKLVCFTDIPSSCSTGCKSRLRKQGLKLDYIKQVIRSIPGCKSRLRKQGLKRKILYLYFFIFISCKSRLRKQGLKQNFICLKAIIKNSNKLQKPSTKTRIETSNLLEKGLIQKTVYLVKWNFTKTNCVVFFCAAKIIMFLWSSFLF